MVTGQEESRKKAIEKFWDTQLSLGVMVEAQEINNDGVTLTRHLIKRTGQHLSWSHPLKWLGAAFWLWFFLHIVFGLGPNWTRSKT